MHRRSFIRNALVGLSAVCTADAAAHTPYRQWAVYRRKHLLIGCHKDENPTYELAKTIVDVLAQHLPDARARVARAPTAQRLASLLGTDQLDVALLSPEIAATMVAGEGQFEAYGQIDLKALHPFADYLLVCRNDIPDQHAWLIADALTDMQSAATSSSFEVNPPIPWHTGAARFRSGQPVPDKEQ